jgi:hypothetical protein
MGTDGNPCDDEFALGCAAVRTLVAARQCLEPLSRQFRNDWQSVPADELRTAFEPDSGIAFRVKRQLAFFYADRRAIDALAEQSTDALTEALRALVDGIWLVAMSKETPQTAQLAAKSACLLLLHSLKHRRGAHIRSQAGMPDALVDAHIHLSAALGVSWDDLERLGQAVLRGRQLGPRALPALTSPDLSKAADVVMAPRPQPSRAAVSSGDAPAPSYDRSDHARRVRRISLAGFRGAPNTLVLDLEQRGAPASALILGDNGTGKSTIVDAIEFALQGRVGRSVAFDGSLAPAAASFATDRLPDVEVLLDDGSIVRRSLVRRDDGRLRDSGEKVRPGFRLAPITLKRQDILRFLDTSAPARGHVFFDYFPASAEEMAIRPEEQLERLDDEAYQLRIESIRGIAELADRLGVAPESIRQLDLLTRVLRERVTGGLTLKQAQETGTWSSVDEGIRCHAETLVWAFERLRKIKRQREVGVENLNPVRYRTQVAVLAKALDGIGDDLSLAFKQISGAEHVTRIDVVFGRSGPVALDIVAQLSSGRRCFPQQLFSEGYRDLLAVLFFAVVARRAAEQGQAKILILDDVFQSVDSTVRCGIVDYLLRDFKDWQLIFTVHDRLWFEQLRTSFRRHGHVVVERELRRWTFEGGPQFGSIPAMLTAELQRQLTHGDPAAICGTAGRLLEQACDQLSSRLGASVTRRREDKYTLGDLWPGVQKACKKTGLLPLCQRIDQLYSLRNLAGAHYNEWANALSLHEASQFGDAVVAFVNATWCPDCHDWVGMVGDEVRCPGRHRAP